MFELEGVEHWYGNTRVLAVDSWRAAAGEPGCSPVRRQRQVHAAARPRRPHHADARAGGRRRSDLGTLARGRATAGAAARSGSCRSGCIWSGTPGLRQPAPCADARRAPVRRRAHPRDARGGARRRPRAPVSARTVAGTGAARGDRACVINRPALVLADEPTANLDDAHATAALELLRTQAQEAGQRWSWPRTTPACDRSSRTCTRCRPRGARGAAMSRRAAPRRISPKRVSAEGSPVSHASLVSARGAPTSWA